MGILWTIDKNGKEFKHKASWIEKNNENPGSREPTAKHFNFGKSSFHTFIFVLICIFFHKMKIQEKVTFCILTLFMGLFVINSGKQNKYIVNGTQLHYTTNVLTQYMSEHYTIYVLKYFFYIFKYIFYFILVLFVISYYNCIYCKYNLLNVTFLVIFLILRLKFPI